VRKVRSAGPNDKISGEHSFANLEVLINIVSALPPLAGVCHDRERSKPQQTMSGYHLPESYDNSHSGVTLRHARGDIALAISVIRADSQATW
jgi:hypothetical protein